jgi:beta-galactosidase
MGLAARSWAQPEIIGWGRLRARSPLVPFPDRESALARDAGKSPWLRSLDGDWRFSLVGRPERVPNDFMTPEFDDTAWGDIEVPGSWTMQGFDRPHYTNVQMPFPNDPPRVPDENPTGLYRRRFELPADWAGRRVVVQFGAAETVLYAWLNGRPLGMSKDSRLPAEFDLTPHLLPGENVLAAMVVRWSDATYLEDQDHWHHAGLHRSVMLYSQAQTYIADVRADGALDACCEDGRLDLSVDVEFSHAPEAGWRVEAQLVGPRGRRRGLAFRRPLAGRVHKLPIRVLRDGVLGRSVPCGPR